ncbi:MAG TPA: stage II sporulation protein E [Clostridiaceae bacterium]|nr:stage II sporulation protein E [Clostridiaceae bacterium]
MKSQTVEYRSATNPSKHNGKPVFLKIVNMLLLKGNIIILPVSFLLGRALLAGNLLPFAIPAYAACTGSGVNRNLVAVFTILGMVSRGKAEQTLIAIAGMFIFNVVNIPFKNKKTGTTLRHAATAFVSSIIPQLILIFIQGFLLYDLLKALLYAAVVFSLTFVFKNAVAFVNRAGKAKIFSNEGTISVAITISLAVLGMDGISLFGLGFKNILCVLIILLFSYKYGTGTGAATGVTTGLIVSMSTAVTPLIIGSYAFCGLLGGLFRNLGKLGASLGFIMGNAVLTLYMNGSTEVIIHLKEIVAAIIGFLIIPQRIVDDICASLIKSNPLYTDSKNYFARVREFTVDKLKKFSKTFEELSKAFNEISQTTATPSKQDISSLFDRVADKVCRDCSLCLYCWDRNFYNTYQVMFKIIERLDSKGRIEEEDIPQYFLDRCERINDFVDSVNNVYEIFKVDMVWKNKIGESRNLVSQQLEGLSKVISDLASEISIDVNFLEDLESVIMSALKKENIKVDSVTVFENKWGKYEVIINHATCGGKRDCISKMEKAVSDILGRKMIKQSSGCMRNDRNGSCVLKLIEEEIYRVTTGVAKMCKYNGVVSGDNYTFMNNGDGSFFVALSDGMGSGQKAAMQSRTTINLLEQFMESGFDRDTTIRMINSILLLKSNDESFSTVDLSVIDLYEGDVEFVKVGAVPTFIKRCDRVEVVKSASLPAGILSNIELELIHKKVGSGDFIIMMTDGVYDLFKSDEGNDKLLKEYIDGIKSLNPQQIADRILEKAYESCEGKPPDDMLVLVVKVWKRAGV